MALTISERFKKLEEKGKQLTGPRAVRVVNEVTRKTRDYMVQRFMGGANTSPNRLARNTGKMEQKTVARRAVKTNHGVTATIAINVPYASVHFAENAHKVTVIRPKKAQSLTIPIFVNSQKRAPYAANSASITGKFTFGNVLYGRLPGEKVKPLFRLRQSVSVPSRISVAKDIQPFADAEMAKAFDREATKIFS